MTARDPRRRFNARERAALLVAAAGHCPCCGDLLLPDFHADHRDPWERGGVTDVINGQALCPTCNRRKGDRSATTTAPFAGLHKAGSSGGAAEAVSPGGRHNSARTHEPVDAGHGGVPECHKERLS
jgi:HNH endonuclease